MGEKATLCVRMTLSETRGAQKASRVALEIKNTNILDLCFFVTLQLPQTDLSPCDSHVIYPRLLWPVKV